MWTWRPLIVPAVWLIVPRFEVIDTSWPLAAVTVPLKPTVESVAMAMSPLVVIRSPKLTAPSAAWLMLIAAALMLSVPMFDPLPAPTVPPEVEPKAIAFAGQVVAVTPDWLYESFLAGKRLPERNYSLRIASEVRVLAGITLAVPAGRDTVYIFVTNRGGGWEDQWIGRLYESYGHPFGKEPSWQPTRFCAARLPPPPRGCEWHDELSETSSFDEDGCLVLAYDRRPKVMALRCGTPAADAT